MATLWKTLPVAGRCFKDSQGAFVKKPRGIHPLASPVLPRQKSIIAKAGAGDGI